MGGKVNDFRARGQWDRREHSSSWYWWFPPQKSQKRYETSNCKRIILMCIINNTWHIVLIQNQVDNSNRQKNTNLWECKFLMSQNHQTTISRSSSSATCGKKRGHICLIYLKLSFLPFVILSKSPPTHPLWPIKRQSQFFFWFCFESRTILTTSQQTMTCWVTSQKSNTT